jgi:hypothetical protein
MLSLFRSLWIMGGVWPCKYTRPCRYVLCIKCISVGHSIWRLHILIIIQLRCDRVLFSGRLCLARWPAHLQDLPCPVLDNRHADMLVSAPVPAMMQQGQAWSWEGDVERLRCCTVTVVCSVLPRQQHPCSNNSR